MHGAPEVATRQALNVRLESGSILIGELHALVQGQHRPHGDRARTLLETCEPDVLHSHDVRVEIESATRYRSLPKRLQDALISPRHVIQQRTDVVHVRPQSRTGSGTVRSLTTLPVLSVPAGSKSKTSTSSSATGRCSMPRGTTIISPGPSSTTPSRNSMRSRPR